MNHKKKLLTTSIIAILFGATQANDYISIISQEKHIYDIVENSLPVASKWLDSGSEFNCVKEFSPYDYPLDEAFTQNEDCLQKQERTVTTTELFNGIPRTTVNIESQNVPVVISYLDTGLENFNTGNQRAEYTEWLNDGTHYSCGAFNPLIDTVNLGETFTQNRNCSQDQTRTETVYDIWADGSEILTSTNLKNQTLNELEYQEEIGNKNFITGSLRDDYTNWTDTGNYYNCTTYLPLVTNVNLNESFTQNRDCSQDQNRTKTVYDIWADNSETINSTNVETQTLTKNESQLATGTKNFNTGTQRTEYTNWLDDGSHYSCDIFSPLATDVYNGKSYTQTRDCSQNQNRTKTVYDIWADNSETINSTNTEQQVLTEAESDVINGTFLAKSCNEILNSNGNVGTGIYNIYPSGTSESAFCDMTTDGGGWTLIGRSHSPVNPQSRDRTSGNFGWTHTMGNVNDNGSAYSMGVLNKNIIFTQILFGEYSNDKNWGNWVYKKNLSNNLLTSLGENTQGIGYSTPVIGGNSGFGMAVNIGAINKQHFFFRDMAVYALYGLYQNGWYTAYGDGTADLGQGAPPSFGGNINFRPGMIFVK